MQLRENIQKTIILVSGLLAVAFAAGLSFGHSGDLATRSLLTLYVGAGTAWAVFFIRYTQDRGYGIAAVMAACLLATGFILAIYSVWFSPGFYAKHWRWMNMLLLADLLFAPLLALAARFRKRS